MDAELEAIGDNFDLFVVRMVRVVMLTARGEADQASELIEWLSGKGRSSEMEWVRAEALLAAALVHLDRGRSRRVREQLLDLADCSITNYVDFLPTVVRTALCSGDTDVATAVTRKAASSTPLSQHAWITCCALLAESREEYEPAAEGFADAAARWHELRRALRRGARPSRARRAA